MCFPYLCHWTRQYNYKAANFPFLLSSWSQHDEVYGSYYCFASVTEININNQIKQHNHHQYGFGHHCIGSVWPWPIVNSLQLFLCLFRVTFNLDIWMLTELGKFWHQYCSMQALGQEPDVVPSLDALSPYGFRLKGFPFSLRIRKNMCFRYLEARMKQQKHSCSLHVGCWGWGDGLDGRVFITQTEGPEFRSSLPCKPKYSRISLWFQHWERETKRAQELTRQLL